MHSIYKEFFFLNDKSILWKIWHIWKKLSGLKTLEFVQNVKSVADFKYL